mgnify:CR=1 FL=1
MPVISAILHTTLDVAGNPRQEGWFLVEFANASYQPGGEVLSLANYFRRVETMQAEMASGAIYSLVKPNEADYPGNPASGRLELWRLNSGGSGVASNYLQAVSGLAVSGVRARLHVLGY